MLSFRLKKQTSKNVADPTFKSVLTPVSQTLNWFARHWICWSCWNYWKLNYLMVSHQLIDNSIPSFKSPINEFSCQYVHLTYWCLFFSYFSLRTYFNKRDHIPENIMWLKYIPREALTVQERHKLELVYWIIYLWK